jgi:hypothetical protein
MRRSFCRKTSALVYAALALAGVAGDHNLSGQTRALPASATNNILVNAALGPTLPAGRSLLEQ